MGWSNALNNKCNKPAIGACGKCGENAYVHPYIYNVLGVAITLLCGMGFVNWEYETDPYYLWTPENDTPIVRYYDYVDKFGEYPTFFLLVARDDNGENLLTPLKLSYLYSTFYHTYVNLNITYEDYLYTFGAGATSLVGPFVNSVNVGGSNIEPADYLCEEVLSASDDNGTTILAKACASLVSSTFYSLFDMNPVNFATQEQIYNQLLDVVTVDQDTIESRQANILLLMADWYYNTTVVLDQLEKGPFLSGGSYLRSRFTLYDVPLGQQFPIDTFGDVSAEEYADILSEANYEWLGEAKEYFEDKEHFDDGQPVGITYVGLTSRSITDETSRTLSHEIPLIIGALLWMFILFALMLGDMGCARGRPWLAIIDIFVVVMSLLIGLGIGFAFGLEMNSLTFLMVFAVICTSFGNELMIMESINNTPLPPQTAGNELTDMKLGARRFWLAIRESGLGLSTAMILKVVAFAAASVIPMPGVRAFCLFTTFSLLAEYFLQWLIFLPVVGLDEHRRMATKSTSQPSSDKDVVEADVMKGGVQWLVTNCLLKMMDEPLKRGCVFFFFLGIWTASIIATVNLEAELDLAFSVPDDSYVKDFFEVYEEGYGVVSYPEIELVMEDLDFSDPDVRTSFYAMLGALADYRTYPNGSQEESIDDVRLLTIPLNWVEAFDEYLAENEPIELAPGFAVNASVIYSDPLYYYGVLKTYIDSTFNFENMIQFDDYTAPAKVTFCKIVMYFLKPKTGDEIYKLTQDLNPIVEEYLGKGKGYVMDRLLPIYYFDSYMMDELIYVLVLMFIVVCVLLPIVMDLRLALFFAFTLFLIYLCIFGWMGMCGLKVDFVTFLMLLFSLTIAVDFLVYATHAMNVSEIKQKRFGNVVMRTTFISLLGVVLLFFSQSNVFRTFATMISGAIISSALHALLFVPAMMGSLDCLFNGTYIPELEVFGNQSDTSSGKVEMGKKAKKGNKTKDKDLVRAQSGHSLDSRSSKGVTGGNESDGEQGRTSGARDNGDQSGNESQSENNFNIHDLATMGRTDSAGPRDIVQAEATPRDDRSRTRSEIKKDMKAIHEITASIMVYAQEFELDKKKKRALKKIVKRIDDFSDAKVRELDQILKQVEVAQERGLEPKKVHAIFGDEIDEFIEENAEFFQAYDDESSQSGVTSGTGTH